MRRWMSTMVVAVMLTALNSGCGVYSFNPKGKSTVKTVAILPFENRTDQYELTDRLTEIIVDQFITDGNLKVVPEAAADATLQGVLLRYQRVAHLFDESDQVQQYKVMMDFEITFRDPKEDKELWKARFNEEGLFDAVEETEDDGQRRAGERLVEAIINRTTKSW